MNMGPAQPPRGKDKVSQYFCNKFVELQEKIDKLEQCKVFRQPEGNGAVVDYLDQPLFSGEQTLRWPLTCYSFCQCHQI